MYRPLLFTVRNHDFCDLISKRNTQKSMPPIGHLVTNIFEMLSPRFMEGCPYYGRIYIPNFDPNEKITDMLPPVVPTGNSLKLNY